MKRFLFMIMVILLVFAAGLPVALSAPDGFEMLMLDSEGVDVVRVQMRLRDLGYISYRATGMYYGMTEKAVMNFQESNDLDADGRLGELTYDKLFSTDVVRKPRSIEIPVTSGPSLVGSPAEYGDLADWVEVVDAAFAVGMTVTVKDFNSGISFEMKRTGGINHAEVEPVDAAAYAEYIKSFGGKPNWEKRSVIVTVGSDSYAASLFGNQMGEDTVSDNTMQGHTCLFFSGSFSHVYGFSDKEHFFMILRAAGINNTDERDTMWKESQGLI